MDFKKEYKKQLELIKKALASQGKCFRNEDIARDLGYTRTYFSTLLGEKGNVTEDHLKALKLTYKEVLENRTIMSNTNGDKDAIIASKNETIEAWKSQVETWKSQVEILRAENDRLRKEVQLSLTELKKIVLTNNGLLRTVLDCQALLRSKALKESKEDANNQIDKLVHGHLRKIQEEYKIDL